MNISGKTKVIGIIGWPVEHSLSPLMHNRAFFSLGLDFVYVPLPVQAQYIHTAVDSLKTLGFVGANVTIPYKTVVMSCLDELDASAQMVGAVNTIVIKHGKSIGYNTDAEGFIRSLSNKDVSVPGRNAVVLGTGGAAQAVIWGLISHNAGGIYVCSRDENKAEQLAAVFNTGRIGVCTYEKDEFHYAIANCDILVNTTPVGMYPDTEGILPIPWQKLKHDAVVCDLIYNPPYTKFLTAARQRGHKVVNGQGMLVEQGALAFELWTNHPAPRSIMYDVWEVNKNVTLS